MGVASMGVNLQLLGITAIPRLAERFGIEVKFPEEREFFGVPPEDFGRAVEEAGRILSVFLEKFKATWWDVYLSSDIGMERTALAGEMQLGKGDRVLDVGCGRGYFSIAAARISKFVVGLDVMDGFGRHGWWRNFGMSVLELGLAGKVFGVRSDARRFPFKDSSFEVSAAVHSVRNFSDKQSIETALKEMRRVVTEGGNVIVVENLPLARTKAQEAHLEMFRCKARYTSGELSFFRTDEIVDMFNNAGLAQIETRELNYEWSAAPPLFCIDSYLAFLPEKEREEAKKSYEEAVAAARKWGSTSTPALLVKATR